MSGQDGKLDLAAVRERLGRERGRKYWRSLEELARTEGFREMLRREFPSLASRLDGPLVRRDFLRYLGASLALAGLTGCTRQPAEAITPYVRQPEDVLPGRPLFYASAMPLGGIATGVLVETHEGRPTKIEGNPEHPGSLGATDVFMQASALGLYDPDRSQTLTFLGEIRPYSAFLAAMRPAIGAQQALKGSGLRILTETVTSPTLAGQIRALLETMPEARWHQYEPATRDNTREGARIAFDEPLNTIHRFERADVVLSLDSDFLGGEPGHLRHVRDFTARRSTADGGAGMNRLYVVEASSSITGAKADHRLLLKPSDVELVAHAIAAELDVRAGGIDAPRREWIAAVVDDLRRHAGSSVVIAGESQPPVVHALVHAINAALGNTGSTVIHTDPLEADPVDQTASLRELVRDMNDGRVDLLLILGGNPVYNAPADLDFGNALQDVELRAHLSLYNDETSELCQWHLPEAHFLEAWSDARAYDGTVSILQPMVEPLYHGRSAHEVLAALTERPDRSGHDAVREHWMRQRPEGTAFETVWRKSLHDGIVAGTRLASRSVSPDAERIARAVEWREPASESEALEVVFRVDPTVYDGRFANNGWLQELPKPLTKLTWDNAALVGVETARRLGLETEFSTRGGEHGEVFADTVELTLDGRTVRAPIWIVPDHPDGCVTLPLGYGRTRAGQVGTGAGFSAFALRTSRTPWSGVGLELRRTGERYALANTQGHWNMEGRDLIRSGSLERYRQQPDLAPEHHHEIPADRTLYPPHEYPGYAWGMSIDLNSCIGCNACVVACQSENNIPVVGKEQVAAGREMHWLRVDRYHKGDPEEPSGLETYFQPVPCMHCENAPCELVCPVAATVHSAEGLNDMVYNRCIGTRYCSNNCPYKVRRFNFFLYQDWETPSLQLQRNPDVTVRSRGVMEKCTYCVQRINQAKIESELEDRKVRDGEIRTACQAACPADAISFGDVNDAESVVARRKSEARSYGLLPNLNTKPRTTYLGAVRNWNDAIRTDADHDETDHES